jgi:hypothetical protein
LAHVRMAAAAAIVVVEVAKQHLGSEGCTSPRHTGYGGEQRERFGAMGIHSTKNGEARSYGLSFLTA